MKNKQLKSFLIGLLVSVVVITSFFLGGIADRLFVLKPLDFFMEQSNFEQTGRSQQTSELGQMMAGGDYSIADVAQQASKSVVTVSIKKQQRVIDPRSLFGQFGFFGFDRNGGSVEEIQQDIGSGFVVEGNLIVTNKHVVSDPQAEYSVIDNNDNEYPVTEIYRDPTLDMAILQVKDFSAPTLALGDSDEVRVGEPVIAIGTALGQFRHTVTTGVVSGLSRAITAGGMSGFENLENVIQTDAAINPGNSGGPLINARGEVIGVNVATAAAENISFAIPINVVRAALENFEETGEFERPMLGVRYSFISERAALANEVPQGAYIVEVIEGSSADNVGLQEGDIIVEFAGEKIDETNELAKLINQQTVGARVNVEIWRNDEKQQLLIRLQKNQN